MFKDFVIREAIETLQEEKDPVWVKLVQLAEAHGIKVFLVNKIADKIDGLYFSTREMKSISNEYRGRIEREADVFAKKLLKLLEKKERSKPDFEPDPPATAGVVQRYVVTTAVSDMAA